MRPEELPSWLVVSPDEQTLPGLKSKGEGTVVFTFDVTRNAPVNLEQEIRFNISTPMGENWTKRIMIDIALPDKYALYQNYPNPFNPTTEIGYQIPSSGRVLLKIYDPLGQEVATLVDGIREAGYHEERWDGGTAASGTYFYRLQATPSSEREGALTGSFVDTKKMLLLH